MNTNETTTAPEFDLVAIADAQPGDINNNGEIERISFLHAGRTVCITYVGGAFESYPTHFTPYVRRPRAVVDEPEMTPEVLTFARACMVVQMSDDPETRRAIFELAKAEMPNEHRAFVEYMGHRVWVAAHADCDSSCAHCGGHPESH